MNILVHSHLFPNPKNSSYGIFVYYYAKELVKCGHDVTVIAPIPYVLPLIKRSHRWYKYKSAPKKRVEGRLKIYYPRFIAIPKRIFLNIRGELLYYSAFQFYKKLMSREKFNIIHAHTVIPDGIIANILSKKHGIPYGITIHGADLQININLNQKCYLKIKETIEKSDFIGLNSNKMKRLLHQYNIRFSSQKTKVIYNGISIPDHIPVIKWDNHNKKYIRILSVGNAIKQKGYEYVIKSISILRKKFDIHYYIIGDGPDIEYFKKIARHEKVDDITFFLGTQNNKKCFGYMKEADIFILPSWDEAFGIVYIEAMSMKIPVIGCVDEGIAEIIQHEENGFLVKSKSVNQIVNILNKLIKNPEIRQRVAEAGYRSVINNFTWKKNANSYLELMRAVLDKSNQV